MKKQLLISFLLLFVFLLGSRLIHLHADLPYFVSYVFSPIDQTDEGWWCRNARLFARTGAWHDGTSFNPMLQSPVHSYLVAAFFKTVGVSWLKARTLSVILGMLACLFIAFALSRHIGWSWSLATVAMFSLHPLFFFFSRIATNEITVTFLTITLISILISQEEFSTLTLFLGGLLFGCAVFTKTTALLLAPGFVIYLVKKTPERWFGYICLVLLGLLICYVAVTMTMPTFAGPVSQMGRHYIGQRLPSSMSKALSFTWGYWSFYFFLMNTIFSPIVAFLALGAVIDFLSAPRENWLTWSALEVASLFWTFTAWLAYSFVIRYARYHLIIVLPMTVLAITAGVRAQAKSPRWWRLAYEALFTLGFIYSAFHWRSQEFTSIPQHSHYFTYRWSQYWYGVALFIAFLLLTRFVLPKYKHKQRALVRKVAFGITLFYVLTSNFFWLHKSEFGTWEAMNEIGQHVPSPRLCIAGTVADTLALEIPNPVVSLSYYAMAGSLEHDLLKARPSYLVLNVPAPNAKVKRFNESQEWLRVFNRICRIPIVADLTPSIPDEGMNIYLYRFERLESK